MLQFDATKLCDSCRAGVVGAENSGKPFVMCGECSTKVAGVPPEMAARTIDQFNIASALVAKEFGLEMLTADQGHADGMSFSTWRPTNETKRLVGFICETIASTRRKRDQIIASASACMLQHPEHSLEDYRQTLVMMNSALDAYGVVLRGISDSADVTAGGSAKN